MIEGCLIWAAFFVLMEIFLVYPVLQCIPKKVRIVYKNTIVIIFLL